MPMSGGGSAVDDPLYREICRNPEDDTLRLAYADWLDENGDPDRAEFIRLHFRLRDWPHRRNPNPYDGDLELRPRCGNHWCRKLDPCRRCVEWCKVVVRAGDVLAAHPEWAVCPCPDCAGGGAAGCSLCGGSGDLLAGYQVEFAAGLPSTVSLPSGALVAWGGVTCPRCDNSTVATRHCRDCGAGVDRPAAPAARAAAVARSTPVTLFVPTDLVPERYEVAGAVEWTWSRIDNNAAERHTLPDEVFWLLAGHAPGRLPNDEEMWRDYETREAAVAAAAAAFGKWVRSYTERGDG